MLVLTRRTNESIRIGDNIVITVVEVRGNKVRLGFVAPEETAICREEVWTVLHGQPPRARLDPAWLAWNEGTVPRLARAIAEEGNYAALPILADALEEAGCGNGEILAHCRSSGPDARSSWVVDLILSLS